MRTFRYESLPMHVIFRPGAVSELRDELRLLGLSKVIVLSTPFEADLAARITLQLGEMAAGAYSKAVQHVPVEVVDEASAFARDVRADGFVSVGGGSTTGLGKAVALRSDLPVIALPTTYAGSEMTTVWGITENGEKLTGRDIRVLPKAVIYDPELTTTLPVGISITSGFNAIAHAIEGLYAPDASPITSLMAAEGVSVLLRALPSIAADPTDVKSRSDALYGAWLCGATLGATTMGLHHKLCHVLGGSFSLPHAETHTVLLPYVVQFNQSATESIQRATGFDNPARGLRETSLRLGAPHSLKELGLAEEAIEITVELATQSPYSNPRPVEPENIRDILHNAYVGNDI